MKSGIAAATSRSSKHSTTRRLTAMRQLFGSDGSGFHWYSSPVFSDNRLLVYRYPDAYTEGREREIRLANGPAVVGRSEWYSPGSHFAWSDPHSMHLNLLNSSHR